MARSRRRAISGESTEMDMTPMIDIVFNLLIFFMVITDLSQKDLADLTLPLASSAVQDKDDDEDDRIILNIDKNGRLLYRDVSRSLDELGTILSQAKREYNLRQKMKGKKGTEKVAGGAEASRLFVLLRADRDTPWQHVQWVMTLMAEEKLFKLQFASKIYADSFYNEEQAKILGGVRQSGTAAMKEGG